MKSCFFIGHHDAKAEVYPALLAEVERHITQYGVTVFFVGHYGNFDRMAAAAVKEAKAQHPEVRLMLVLPYHPAERAVPIPVGFDGSYYPDGMETVPRRFAIARANKKMVDTSNWLISYVCHPGSNARNLLEYAQRREKKGLIHIENLAGGLYENGTANTPLDTMSCL